MGSCIELFVKLKTPPVELLYHRLLAFNRDSMPLTVIVTIDQGIVKHERVCRVARRGRSLKELHWLLKMLEVVVLNHKIGGRCMNTNTLHSTPRN